MIKVLALDYDGCGTHLALWYLVFVPWFKEIFGEDKAPDINKLYDLRLDEATERNIMRRLGKLEMAEYFKEGAHFPVSKLYLHLKKLQPLLSYIQKEEFSTLISFSARISHYRDKDSCQQNHMGRCLEVYPELAKAMGLTFDTMLLPDLYNKEPAGTEFVSKARGYSPYSAHRDFSKIHHSLTILYYFSLSAPDETFSIHFIDDVAKIIKTNRELYKDKPGLIPCNVAPIFVSFTYHDGELNTEPSARTPTVAQKDTSSSSAALGLDKETLKAEIEYQKILDIKSITTGSLKPISIFRACKKILPSKASSPAVVFTGPSNDKKRPHSTTAKGSEEENRKKVKP